MDFHTHTKHPENAPKACSPKMFIGEYACPIPLIQLSPPPHMPIPDPSLNTISSHDRNSLYARRVTFIHTSDKEGTPSTITVPDTNYTCPIRFVDFLLIGEQTLHDIPGVIMWWLHSPVRCWNRKAGPRLTSMTSWDSSALTSSCFYKVHCYLFVEFAYILLYSCIYIF